MSAPNCPRCDAWPERRKLDGDEPGQATGPQIPGLWQCGSADIGWSFLERYGCLCRQKIALVSALRGLSDAVENAGKEATQGNLAKAEAVARATVAKVETKKKGHI